MQEKKEAIEKVAQTFYENLQEKKEAIEKVAQTFYENLLKETGLEVLEAIYVVAVTDPNDKDNVVVVSGSTCEAPQGARLAMLQEAIAMRTEK